MADEPRLQSLGERIKHQREQKSWSQRELARRARVTYSLISRLESGETEDVFASRLRRIARALNVGMDYLLNTFHGDPDDDPRVSPEAVCATVERETLLPVITLCLEDV